MSNSGFRSVLTSMTATSYSKNLYREWLAEERRKESNVEIPNEFPWNAKIALEELVQFGLTFIERDNSLPAEIRILTGTLSGNVYDKPWQNLLERFLSRGGKVRILFWNSDTAVQKSLRDISANIRKSKGLEARLSGSQDYGDRLSHFVVVCGQAYRIEAPHPHFESEAVSEMHPEVPSRICFNNREEAKELTEFFDAVWSGCHVVSC